MVTMSIVTRGESPRTAAKSGRRPARYAVVILWEESPHASLVCKGVTRTAALRYADQFNGRERLARRGAVAMAAPLDLAARAAKGGGTR